MISNLKKLKADGKYHQLATLRFRGHADAYWKLETTLERFTKQPSWCQEQYFKTIRDVRPSVISMTGKHWDIPDEFQGGRLPPLGYELMIYLRHHGFPSPLLDWTRSPYVAAFFAFQEKRERSEVAIYSYIEHFQTMMIDNDSSEPTVRGLGPYAVTHKRHYAQQCEYSICEQKIDGKYVYGSHQNPRFEDHPNSNLGPLTKYILPVGERTKALNHLHSMNVTAFSLFGSEESLMETLAYQEIETRLID